MDIFTSEERITVFANPQFEAGSVTILKLDLFVEQLSYADAGTYVCEAEENGETVSASVDVELEGMEYNSYSINIIIMFSV